MTKSLLYKVGDLVIVRDHNVLSRWSAVDFSSFPPTPRRVLINNGSIGLVTGIYEQLFYCICWPETQQIHLFTIGEIEYITSLFQRPVRPA